MFPKRKEPTRTLGCELEHLLFRTLALMHMEPTVTILQGFFRVPAGMRDLCSDPLPNAE